MLPELSKTYEPAAIQGPITKKWLDHKAFAAHPDAREERYIIMMPLPNVTGALHMGHAMDNVMQDLLTRWHRMRGDNALWQPGTDHAGIGTQAVVEKRLHELEKKTRHDLGREGLVRRIWEWKDQYQARIIQQQQQMGCSCDWDRQRFTMDPVCARAVRHWFFRMFRDGLIYRGNRLVNWDCFLQTAVADDETYHEKVRGHFWHLRYPVLNARAGEPKFVVVATTRPETMLADTAVAVHPDPAAALERVLQETRARLAEAPAREKPALEQELERIEARKTTHLPTLQVLASMAMQGRRVEVPLVERAVPIILDEWAKPELGSGCVKITPGHDPNDYEVWKRHQDEIGIVSILNQNGTLNDKARGYAGLDRFDARKRVVKDLEARGLLESVEDREVEVGHSDRSKTIIEPFLSKQWFVRMGDVPDGVVMGRGTRHEFRAPGLAQAAMDAARGSWRSPSGRKVTFWPDPVRYEGTYHHWLEEKRDWCISRQLWWGHQIPIWTGHFDSARASALEPILKKLGARADACVRDGEQEEGKREILVCLLDQKAEQECAAQLEKEGFARDPDVLDTWFSSALWPHSTLGWPDPSTAETQPGQTALAAPGQPTSLDYYYPGSCLVTGRDIITLWVARMVIAGLYNLGDVPFTDVFIHATILDGKGERMSKSKGNGIDPVDIIEAYGVDAMRYVLCEMQTGTQDIRLPVQAISPFTQEPIDLATAKHGQTIFTYLCPKSGKEFDVLGSMPGVPQAKLISDRFEVGRNFCNKLWNAARFALMNLERVEFRPRKYAELPLEDRWILSRLQAAIGDVQAQLQAYNPAAAIGAARDFFWNELCDWYLELIKPRMRDAATAGAARQVLAFAVDKSLRLFHPFLPFITEALWERLNLIAPQRGIDAPVDQGQLILHAKWPFARKEFRDTELEAGFELAREVVRATREVRQKYNVPPGKKVAVAVKAAGATATTLERFQAMIAHMANLERVDIGASATRSRDAATAIVRDVEIYVAGVVDLEKEKARLVDQQQKTQKQIDGIRQKLGNESFTQKARPEVIERERARLLEFEAQLRSIEQSLRELGCKP